MSATIGIRREDKNEWERRAPLTPDAVARLVASGYDVVVQPSDLRIFSDDEYRRAGATVAEDLSASGLVIAVKEIPADLIHGRCAYLFFSHTIKGQAHNMGLLRRVLDTEATLIDYEPVVGQDGLRLVHFGRFAGLAGAIDGLWGLGQRVGSPLAGLGAAWSYPDLATALAAVRQAGERIRADGFGPAPLVIGVVGDGNVARGSQEVLDALGAVEIAPADLDIATDPHTIYRVTFRETDTVTAGDAVFDVADYRSNPQRYRSTFNAYLPKLTLLINAMYWDERAPRLVSRDDLLTGGRLQMIADLSCDIDGGVEATVRSTTPDDPVYVYDPTTAQAVSGFEGPGVAVLAVDHLPCELPLDASRSFSDALEPWIPALADADYAAPVMDLPAPWRNAVIAHRGALTRTHAWLEGALSQKV